MVGAATGAGTGSGSMSIKGTLDTSLIERGFERIRGGFDRVKGFAKGFTADTLRMVDATRNLTKNLVAAGMFGAAAMISLAKSAPAVAGAMAQMQIGFMKLSFAAGEALAPAFEKVAGWLDKFATWTYDHPKIFAGVVISLTALSVLKFTGVGGILVALAKTIVSPSVLTALGLMATIAAPVVVAGAAGVFLGFAGKDLAVKHRQHLIEEAWQMPGTLESMVGIDPEIIAKLNRGEYIGSGGMISAGESRKHWFLRWLDAIWTTN